MKVRVGETRTLLSFPTYSGSGQSLAGGVICKERIVEDYADCRTQAISVAGNNKQQLKTASEEAWRVFGALALLTRWEGDDGSDRKY